MTTEIIKRPEADYPDILPPDDSETYAGIVSDIITYVKNECQHTVNLYDKEIAIQKARLLSGRYTFEQEEQIADRISNAVANQEKSSYRREKMVCFAVIGSIGLIYVVKGVFKIIS